MATVADVFIIETLDPDDEGNGRFEGSSITHVLRLHGKQPEYRYVRTKGQLALAIKEFSKSNYRYLHISSHGNEDGMVTTNLDEISHAQLASMLSPALAHKRLFLSACSMVNQNMAAAIIPKTNCYSVVGPRREIGFTEAAVFWPALYHLLFVHDPDRVKGNTLAGSLGKVAKLFEVGIGYYSISQGSKKGFKRRILRA